MNPKENYLHEFFRIFFANKQLVKRIFLIFAVIALVLPLLLKQSFDITAQVIVQSKKLSQGDATTSLTGTTLRSFRRLWRTWKPRAISCARRR
jgi:uncharacterized protein involved in exopolysaccharide biosynthesis